MNTSLNSFNNLRTSRRIKLPVDYIEPEDQYEDEQKIDGILFNNLNSDANGSGLNKIFNTNRQPNYSMVTNNEKDGKADLYNYKITDSRSSEKVFVNANNVKQINNKDNLESGSSYPKKLPPTKKAKAKPSLEFMENSKVDSPHPAKRRKPGRKPGRKASRNIEHSIIERRRRDRMNSEFAALRDLIPSCKHTCLVHGDDALHKLTILRATTDYIRYLEECISLPHGTIFPEPPNLPTQPCLPLVYGPLTPPLFPECAFNCPANITDSVNDNETKNKLSLVEHFLPNCLTPPEFGYSNSSSYSSSVSTLPSQEFQCLPPPLKPYSNDFAENCDSVFPIANNFPSTLNNCKIEINQSTSNLSPTKMLPSSLLNMGKRNSYQYYNSSNCRDSNDNYKNKITGDLEVSTTTDNNNDTVLNHNKHLRVSEPDTRVDFSHPNNSIQCSPEIEALLMLSKSC